MDDLAAAYVARLGLTGAPPTLATLVDVHHAHLDLLPYNNLDIMVGAACPVDEASCLRQVVDTARSGYCFHQNGVLGAGLRHLGFAVEQRHGHVWTDPGRCDDVDLNHLVLLVTGLPTDANPGGAWWPDVGLGEGFVDPVPLVEGACSDPVLDLTVTGLDDTGWSLLNDPRGAFTGVLVRALPLDVEAAHAELSTPPDGHFSRILVVQRRTPGAVETLRGCVLTALDADGVRQQDLTTYDGWRDALAHLRLSLTDIGDDRLRALWQRSWQAHGVWDSAGRP